MKLFEKHTGKIAAGSAFLAAFAFFQFAYPYHIMRREQMNLFLFDWDYIRQTYKGAGWLARFTSDFLDQFFGLPVAGPLIVALLVTAVGAAAYGICRHFLGKWPSLAVGAAFFLWSFFRETENLYTTRYTVSSLLFLVLILLALKFRKTWMKAFATVLLLALGVWSLGSPVHKYYGRAWGWPRIEYDKVIGLDTETYRENWDKIITVPASSVYYSDRLDTTVVVGDGSGYNAGLADQIGTAASQSAGNVSGSFFFTFYGTGIDVYCTTHKDAGHVSAAVFKGAGEAACAGAGGMIVAEGTPEQIAAAPESYTGRFLRSYLHL